MSDKPIIRHSGHGLAQRQGRVRLGADLNEFYHETIVDIGKVLNSAAVLDADARQTT